MAVITSGLQLTMQNNTYGIASETTLTNEVRATPAPTTTTITNSFENGTILSVYTGVFNPDQFDPTFQDNTAGITAITGYQEYLATDTTNASGLNISGWLGETFDSLSSPNFDTLYGGDDSITSSAFDDLIRGYDGADTLNGGAGNDTVIGGQTEVDTSDGANEMYGGLGTDSLHGGSGADVIYGGQSRADSLDSGDFIQGGIGADTLFGNAGNDTIYGELSTGDGIVDAGFSELIYGGKGSDMIFGQLGDDILAGGGGLAHPNDQADTISGGGGNDTITGNGEGDSIDGDAGDDSIFGGLGNDMINGGTGADALMGLKDNDTLTGGDGADIFHFRAGDGVDVITDFNNGGDGAAVDIMQFDTDLGVSSFAELQAVTAVIEGITIYSFSDGTVISLTGVTGVATEDVAFVSSSTFFADVLALGF